MKKKLITTSFIAGSLFLFSMILGFKSIDQNEPWPVPEKYLKMVNPVKADAESISEGKALWSKHCKSCHGVKGLGDGPKAAQLKTESGDLSSAEVQKQPDGSLFYKTSEGRKDMPRFKKDLPDDEDRWNLVNYIRTLKKK